MTLPGDGTIRQQQLLADASRYLAGGGTGLFVLPADLNLVVDHGRGSRVVDIAGREYIDYHLGSGPVLLGHGHAGVAAAVERRLHKGSTYFFLNEPEIELARRLVDAIPCAECVHYTGSGTEATYYALRIARAHTGRAKVLKFEGAWHGMHDWGLFGTVPAQPSPYPRALPDSVGVPAALADYVLVSPFNDTQAALELIERHAHELAAVIIEPLQRVLLPEPGFLQAMREATARHGIVLIFDEVMTGFRVSLGGAQAHYGVTPDLTTLGKVIGGGMPVGAYGGRRDLMEMVAPAGTMYQAGTLSGNPVAMAAGITTLDVLARPGMFARAETAAARLVRLLTDWAADRELPFQATRAGTMWGSFFTATPVVDYATAKTADTARYAHIFHELLREGVYLAPSQFEAGFTSVMHNDEVMDAVEAALARCDV